MSTIYVLRRDDDSYENFDDIAIFDDEESAKSYKAAYALMSPQVPTVISPEEVYSGVLKFAPLYHYSVRIPTVGDSDKVGDNEVIKTNLGGLIVERVVNESDPLPSSGVSFSTHIAGTRIVADGFISRHVQQYTRVLVVDAYGYSEEEVTNRATRLIADIRALEKIE